MEKGKKLLEDLWESNRIYMTKVIDETGKTKLCRTNKELFRHIAELRQAELGYKLERFTGKVARTLYGKKD